MSAEAYYSTDEDDVLPTSTDETNAEPEPLPLDITFEILKNARRRLVLEYLRDAEDTVTIGELAEHIAAIENDTTVQQLNAQQRKRVYIGLYQCHLPKMDDAGVVDFNQSRGLVDVEPAAEPLYEYLDVEATPASDSNPIYYGGLALGAGLLFVAAHALNTPPVTSVVVFALLVLAVAASVYRVRQMDD